MPRRQFQFRPGKVVERPEVPEDGVARNKFQVPGIEPQEVGASQSRPAPEAGGSSQAAGYKPPDVALDTVPRSKYEQAVRARVTWMNMYESAADDLKQHREIVSMLRRIRAEQVKEIERLREQIRRMREQQVGDRSS